MASRRIEALYRESFDELLDEWDEEVIQSATGLSSGLFNLIYEKYCGPHTPVKDRFSLWRVFMWLKAYPTFRAAQVTLWVRDKGSFFRWLDVRLSFLADVLYPLVEERFRQRRSFPGTDGKNPVRRYFGVECVGAVDTCPIIVSVFFVGSPCDLSAVRIRPG